MDWWTWAIFLLSSLAFIMFTRLTMPQLDVRGLGVGFLLLVLMLQYCDNKPTGCAMPYRNASEISLSFCSLRELPELITFKSYESMIKLNVSHNDLQKLDPDLFKFNLKLAYLDLSYNPNLGKDFHGTECIIKSESVRQLNLAFTGFGLIQPESICVPNIRNINLVGVNSCEQTLTLFKRNKPFVIITCGGSGPEPISEGTTLSPLNTQSSTISGPTKTTGDSAHGPSSMTHSSGATTQQLVTASPTSASKSTSVVELDKEESSTTGPNKTEGTHLGVWVGLGIASVLVIVIILTWNSFVMALRNICHVHSICENNNANTEVNSENSPEDNESDTEQSSILNR